MKSFRRRALQISKKLMINLELEIWIRRYLFNNTYEEWKINELKLDYKKLLKNSY